MVKAKPFKSIHIDIEKGIYKINGCDISESGWELNLNYEKGSWSLMVTESTLYTSDQKVKKGARDDGNDC